MKKYIFFIVEGKHDKDEISAILNTPYYYEFRNYYEPCFLLPFVNCSGSKVKFSNQAGGDITADKKTTASNVLDRLSQLINDYRRNGKGYPIAHRDIAKIIHIADTDGTFISSDRIVSSDDSKPKYLSQTIETSNIDGIIGRNRRKSEVLKKLMTVNQVCNIPYSIFYVSCNMDHVLFDECNITPSKKTFFSLDFQSTCERNPEIIYESILKEGIATSKSYSDSWEEIQLANNSLLRKTNLNLILSELSLGTII